MAKDIAIAKMIDAEERRQKRGISLIPSENIVSKEVLRANVSVLTNKYSEGYPGKRYYAGNEIIDQVETLAIERVKKLFGAEHANVQGYSGSSANAAVYYATMKPGDTFMSLKLDHGGHLTHGHQVNFSNRFYKPVHYGVRKDTELIDYDEMHSLARKHKPKLIVAGFTAYPRTVDWKRFREICDETGAVFFVDMSHIAGLVAGRAIESPVPYADIIMTTTHKTLRGPRGAIILSKESFAKNIDRAIFPGMQGGPHNNTIAAMAVAFKEALQPSFRTYARQIIQNSKALGREVEKDMRLVTGGTDTHLLLADLAERQISGKVAERTLEMVGISTNKNTVPYEIRTPLDPSGLRFGTPTATSRGMKEKDMKRIGQFMIEALAHHSDNKSLQSIRSDVEHFCKKFPIYPHA